MNNLLESFEDFELNEFFGGTRPIMGKSYLVTKKVAVEDVSSGETIYIKPGELIENIKDIDKKKGFIYFDRKTTAGETIKYAIRYKDFLKSVSEEVEFPRDIILDNLSTMIVYLKNLKIKIDSKEMKGQKKRIHSDLKKKTDAEISNLIAKFRQFNVIFSAIEKE